MNQDNAKWQLGFWIMSVVCVGGMLTMVGYVVANDKAREKGDTEIRYEYKKADDDKSIRIEQKIEQEVQKLEDKIDDIKAEQTVQKVQAAEILTMLKQVYKEVKQ